MKVNFKWVAIIVFILLLGVGGGFFYLQSKNSSQSNLPAGLTTALITRETITGQVGSTGKVRANQIVDLKWQTVGTVGKVNVKDLDQVKA
ncbi:MAG TPA: efflux RND transporter periplasmic adaptor subunit, partial [Leptolinea sp.]